MHASPYREIPRPRGKTRRVVAGALATLAALAVLGWAWVWFAPCALGGCAPVDEIARFQAEGSQLLDIDGEPFGTLATVNRRIVPLDSLPAHLSQAFLAIEDRRFYRHGGIDWRRLGGAVRQTATAVAGQGGRVEGGSTITMQLARNLFPDQLPYTERSLRRKIMEARIARQLERSFSKDKILELYLNHIYLGAGAYGVEAAAQTYFGKPAAEVTLDEAAVLAALPQAPSFLDPTRNPEGAKERRNLVLREMVEARYVTPEQAETAREQPIRLTRARRNDSSLEAGYFVERVRRELEEQVGDRYYTAGLRVYTTLDRTAQRASEEELARQLERIESGHYGHYRHARFAEARGVSGEAGRTPYLQGVAVVLDAGTGAVLALVGGRDWDDSKFDRAVQALRQPGSAFKPFVYLAALERYRSPVDLVDDAPLRLELAGGRVWEPRNYGDRYDGIVTLRDALVRSKNTATVRLAQELGLGPATRTAHDLGIASELPDFPSTALGSAEVRPLELVSSYAAFANGGYRVQPHFVRRIEDRNGRVLWEAMPERRQVINPAAAFVLTSMLRDVVDRGTGTAVRAAGFRGPAAGKTGTTNGNTDVWFIGYTPDLVAGVWIGLDAPATIVRGASGGTLAAPVWGEIMQRIYQRRRLPEAWQPPSGVSTEQVDRTTGAVVSANCPARGDTYTEYFVGSPPFGHCPTGGYPALAADGSIWGDEEWDTASHLADSLPERGIYWPELERQRATEEGYSTTAPAAERAVVSPPDTAAPAERDTVARDTGSARPPGAPRDTGGLNRPQQREPVEPRDSFVYPDIREEDLPGVPVRRDTTPQRESRLPPTTPTRDPPDEALPGAAGENPRPADDVRAPAGGDAGARSGAPE